MSNTKYGVPATIHARRAGVRPQNYFWEIIRDAILKRDKYRCRKCGKSSDLSVHHIIPLSEGGNSMPKNLITLCSECHDGINAYGGGMKRDGDTITEVARSIAAAGTGTGTATTGKKKEG
jgi:hypothetical protein